MHFGPYVNGRVSVLSAEGDQMGAWYPTVRTFYSPFTIGYMHVLTVDTDDAALEEITLILVKQKLNGGFIER